MLKMGELQITCQTEGASIGYKRLQDLKEGLGWQIYTAPIGVDQEAAHFGHCAPHRICSKRYT